jgi:fatty-acid peroxygenase
LASALQLKYTLKNSIYFIREERLHNMKMTDDTLAMLKNPYRFISNKCKDLNSDVFETRIFMQKAYCMTGKEACELFYNPEYFIRSGASPESVRATLFGKGGVQGLDGKAHAHRKMMIMSLMTHENLSELNHLFHEKLRHYLKQWSLKESIVLYDELQKALTEAACAWVGVPLIDEDKNRRTKEIVSLFDAAGAKGIQHFFSRISRKNAEDWIQRIVTDLRSDGFEPLIKSPMEVIIWHRDHNDELLSTHTAAVEILNLIRPTVATSVYMAFMAHALITHPETYDKLLSGDENYTNNFINEVRRFYPFFPSVMSRVKENFSWKNIEFKKGSRVFLDLWGTNNDPRLWDSPHTFWPERFDLYPVDDFSFIPQGGGSAYRGHRCAGENFTVELMKTALNFLLFEMDYEVPEQNLNIDWSRLPAIPESRIILKNIDSKTIFVRTTLSEIEVTQIF